MSQQSVTRFTKVGIDLLARVGQLKKLKIVMEGKFFLSGLDAVASISLYPRCLYQLDRTLCDEVDGQKDADIPVTERCRVIKDDH